MLGGDAGARPPSRALSERSGAFAIAGNFQRAQPSLSELGQRLPPRDSRPRRVSSQGCTTASAPCFNVCRRSVKPSSKNLAAGARDSRSLRCALFTCRQREWWFVCAKSSRSAGRPLFQARLWKL